MGCFDFYFYCVVLIYNNFRYQLIEKLIFHLIYTALFTGVVIVQGVAFNFGTYLFLHKGTPYGINNYETILL